MLKNSLYLLNDPHMKCYRFFTVGLIETEPAFLQREQTPGITAEALKK